MLHLLPWHPSNRLFQLTCEQLLSEEEQEIDPASKKARKTKQAQGDRSVMYELHNGRAIQMEWVLIIMLLQSHLCQAHPLHPAHEPPLPLE